MSTEKELRELKEWKIGHEVEYQNWWKDQRNWNKRMEKGMSEIAKRVRSFEHKVILFTGACAGIGSLIAVVVTALMK